MTKTKIPEYLSKFAQDNNEDMIMTSNHGYVIAPQKILRCFRLNEIEKLVLLELLSYMGEKDCAFPSHKRLAFKLGKKSVSSIKKALNSLKDKGFIKWSKGDGDIGSNRYRLLELRVNPYIILSEFVHRFEERILDEYGNDVSYEAIYGSILNIVEKQGADKGTDDVYGICLKHLTNDIQLTYRLNMYDLLAEHLLHAIFLYTKMTLKIDTLEFIEEHFEMFHPFIKLDYEDHAINKDLKGPNDSKEFEVIDSTLSPQAIEIGRKEYPRIEAYLKKQDNYTLYKWFLYNIILPNSAMSCNLDCNIDDFINANEAYKIEVLEKEFTIEMVKVFLINFHIEVTIHKALNNNNL